MFNHQIKRIMKKAEFRTEIFSIKSKIRDIILESLQENNDHLSKDMEKLLNLWREINQKAMKGKYDI